MFHLALRSLRFRAGALAATFIAMFLSALILMAFASMLDTSTGSAVSATDEQTLTTMATVVGGWGLLIAAFAVASTLALSVHQRAAEMALLKSIGASPGQLRRLILGETAMVAVIAAVAAIVPAIVAGGALLELLKQTDQVGSGVTYRFGPVALCMGLGITLAAAMIAAFVTARRITRGSAAQSLLDASIGSPRMGRKRIVAACLFLGLGINLAVVTATAMRDQGYDAMATAGQGSIFFAIGLALLAPLLIRTVSARLAGLLRPTTGVSGYLAAVSVRQRTQPMASALMPIILFTGIAVGTFYMQSIENAATAAEGGLRTTEQRNIETLNFVVVGMIALFAAVMLINTLVAATAHRRREFGQQRLAGSTPPQVLRTVSLEALVLVCTGVLFGSVASVFTIIPYSIARTGAILPDATIVIYLAIVAAAAILTLASSVGAARSAMRGRAVEAVAT